ncbi:hypothetical protein GQ54DRAFT_297863 [Martensiomyces pterosporus]|nr:hypothetical protein GQ54DRAFT_297863 [Martensiomyces pterosporus]
MASQELASSASSTAVTVNLGKILGIGLGVGFGTILLSLLLGYFCYFRPECRRKASDGRGRATAGATEESRSGQQRMDSRASLDSELTLHTLAAVQQQPEKTQPPRPQSER